MAVSTISNRIACGRKPSSAGKESGRPKPYSSKSRAAVVSPRLVARWYNDSSKARNRSRSPSGSESSSAMAARTLDSLRGRPFGFPLCPGFHGGFKFSGFAIGVLVGVFQGPGPRSHRKERRRAGGFNHWRLGCKSPVCRVVARQLAAEFPAVGSLDRFNDCPRVCRHCFGGPVRM